MCDEYLAALDQPTGLSRCVISDQALRPVAPAQMPVTIPSPPPGWREYAPQELLKYSSSFSLAQQFRSCSRQRVILFS